MAEFNLKALEKLTTLARIRLGEEEKETFVSHLDSILDYVEQLSEVETEGVPSCNHVLEEMAHPLREDQADSRLDRETFLLNSPSHVGGMIRVPPVIKF